MPTTVTRPRPRPQRFGSMIVAALAMAQVPRSLRAFGHGERALSACAGQCRGLRHAVAADGAEHHV